MKTLWRAVPIAILAAVILVGFVQQVSAAPPAPILLGTTGACFNNQQGSPCTQQSTLVQIDPKTGKLIKTIGPVGYTVNGLAWDTETRTLYATTAAGDVRFHGLIAIDIKTGAGTPVDPSVVNFGLAVDPRFNGSPIHSITVGFFGQMVGWYDEFPPPVGITDTFVHIDKKTGVAREFTNTGIDTSQNGLSFSDLDLLWNVDSPRFLPGETTLTQTAYLINPFNGKPYFSKKLTPPTSAALGDFSPKDNLYYGLNFEPGSTHPAFLVVVNVLKGTVKTIGQTVDNLHVVAFVKSH